MKGTGQIKPFPLRLPLDLREWVAEQAQKNARSQNGEIVSVLRKERERCEAQRAA